ncbi:hypothetical protein Salat_1514300 [Sesamum alatum]|uniref:Uncharacterized protein n=1 Tax=Sesamum alatum TaxID=300844 RepID=A0AAE1YCD3_9LAMI|nr:hypothetical protein Salat_1514300 [Sesamum alatum]
MNTSPIFSTADYRNYEYDYQADFTQFTSDYTQFLEEARKNACLGNLHTTHLEAAGDSEKKNRKTWKSSLFSWLKTDKKRKSTKQLTNGSTVCKPRRQHYSGPVEGQGTVGGIMTGRAQKAASGPLISVTKRAEEYEVPYMSLGQQLHNPHKLHSYGPVYLVT